MAFFVALDVGTKTIGIARADVRARLASPWTTLERQGVKKDVARLQEQFETPPEVVVVGLPLDLDGNETRSCRLARQVAEALEAQGHSVVFQDERFSTVEATRRLHEAGHDSRKQRGIIDQAAAAVILQDWLDRQEG